MCDGLFMNNHNTSNKLKYRRSNQMGEGRMHMAECGKLIVIDGLDGSGKATQAELLEKEWNRQGKAVRKVSFPNYDSDSSALVRMYLSGQFGKDPEAVNAYAASSFYTVDRYASYKTLWGEFYRKGGSVVADRYTTSNAIHQCAKLPSDKWGSFLDWLFYYEYELLGLPAPDLVIYLDVDLDISHRLLKERYGGDTCREDIHERNMLYLEHSRTAAYYCWQKLGWQRIACCADGEMRPVEDIQRDVLTLVNSL